ncbi:MAG TPA: 30S ribosomal protein S12 methylthiotransferase RimO [Vicinamibacterales bacterium]
MKIGLVSLGCPKNLVDSEVMLGLARQAGHELTPDAAEADVLVVNTCAFIDRAKQESVDTILELAEQKKAGRCTRLVVTGCLAERYRDELKAQIPEIDVVLGTGEVESIVDALGPSPSPVNGGAAAAAPVTLYRRPPAASAPNPGRAGAGSNGTARVAARHREAIGVRELPTYLYDATTPRLLTTPRHYAYVKIAEGCDYNCAFCIIPRLRGPYRSRSVESIVAEARHLAERGVRELLLVSQDSTFFGIDRRERGALARLLRELNTIDGLRWIRLLYLYPTTITDETIDAMAACDKVVPYIDLPLQHGADSMLKRMRRPGTRASYERLLFGLRERIPGVTLRTTFVVGFPGETEEEFDELCDFVRAVEFDHVGVFTYSHEEGTAAYALADDVPLRTKKARQRKLMGIQQRIVRKRHRSLLGQRVQVLVDGPSPEHELVLQARMPGQAPDIDPVVYLSEADPELLKPGDLVEAEVVDSRGYDLVARVLEG